MSAATKNALLRLVALAVAVTALTTAACVVLTAARQPGSDKVVVEPPPTPVTENSDPDPFVIPVKVIRPKHDPSFTMTVTEPAHVEAYYKSELKARVSGSITRIRKDIGARVKRDEILAEIDAPDLVQAVAQAEKVIQQREREEDLARAKVKAAEAEVLARTSNVAMKQKLLKAYDSIQQFRYSRWKRYEGLAQLKGVDELLVEEQEKNYLGAYADYEAANDAVTQAQAKQLESQHNLEVAKTDVAYRHSLIEVAEKERDKAKAFADYTVIRAPYDGVIVARNVDPGSFVDVGSSKSDPLFIVERTDIVTVYMNVPDTFAPYVTDGTEAIITMTPGVEIHGKVTRHDPSLETSHTDLTMRVEVDLWNDSPQLYKVWLASEEAKKLPAVPFDDLKAGDDPAKPVQPWLPWIEVHNPNAAPPKLLPGMYGTMELVLRNFKSTYLLPSDAIIQQGGESYIYLLQGSKAQKSHVDVQANDGKLAKVAVIVKKGKQEIREALTGEEQVIYSNLDELSSGQAVKPEPITW